VFNGDIGTIIQIDNEEMELSVSFKAGKEVKEVRYTKEHLLELDLAYAITIHPMFVYSVLATLFPLL
jgi:exodeoxyribonuclease V alpha subunit